RLERVKRDADQQDHLSEKVLLRHTKEAKELVGIGDWIGKVEWQTEVTQEDVEIVGKESRVLEVAEEAEVADQADDEPKLAVLAPFHHHEHQVIDGRCAEEQQEIVGVPPAV